MTNELIDIDNYFSSSLKEFKALPSKSESSEWYCEKLSEAAEQYRWLAIIKLLLYSENVAFHENLKASGRCRIKLLEISQHQKIPCPQYTYFSNSASFFDSLASGDLQSAKDIALLSTAPFDEDYEYAEDYTYTKFLYHLTLNDFETDDTSQAILDQLLIDCEGDEIPQYRLCKALQDKNEILFDEALVDRLVERADLYEQKGETMVIESIQYKTERFIFVEGYALLFVADSLNFKTDREYRFLPSCGRFHLYPT